jgi:hypothetical protein
MREPATGTAIVQIARKLRGFPGLGRSAGRPGRTNVGLLPSPRKAPRACRCGRCCGRDGPRSVPVAALPRCETGGLRRGRRTAWFRATL